jgi:hypothetical protein
MRLEIRGMDIAEDKFVSLWGMYVSGFRADKHCVACLKGKREARVVKTMVDGIYELDNTYRYFYLCALGRAPRKDTNVHLAVEPRQGAVASVGSMYGVTFTIHDALAIRVAKLPIDWLGLGKEFTQCPNFQFGVQQFGYPCPDGLTDFGDHSLLPEFPPDNDNI